MHGGTNPGPPPGNANAVSTGEYENIIFEVLPDDERAAIARVETDPRRQLENELRLVDVRLRRMHQRLGKYKELDLEVVEETEELEAEIAQTQDAMGRPSEVLEKPARTKRKRKLASTLSSVLALEEAITRVQSHKAKLLDQLVKMQEGGSGGSSNPSAPGGSSSHPAAQQVTDGMDAAELARLYREAVR